MTSLTKSMAIALVAFGMIGVANLAQAGCGSCGGDAGHKHEGEAKVTCVKCDHAKACTAEDCADAAHSAECICVKKEEATADTAS